MRPDFVQETDERMEWGMQANTRYETRERKYDRDEAAALLGHIKLSETFSGRGAKVPVAERVQ